MVYLIFHYFWYSAAFSWYLYVKSTGYPYLERNNSCQEVQFTLGRDSWWRENRKYTSGVVFYVHILLSNYHISCTKQINSLVLFLLLCVRDMLCCLVIDRCIHDHSKLQIETVKIFHQNINRKTIHSWFGSKLIVGIRFEDHWM